MFSATIEERRTAFAAVIFGFRAFNNHKKISALYNNKHLF